MTEPLGVSEQNICVYRLWGHILYIFFNGGHVFVCVLPRHPEGRKATHQAHCSECRDWNQLGEVVGLGGLVKSVQPVLLQHVTNLFWCDPCIRLSTQVQYNVECFSLRENTTWTTTSYGLACKKQLSKWTIVMSDLWTSRSFEPVLFSELVELVFKSKTHFLYIQALHSLRF